MQQQASHLGQTPAQAAQQQQQQQQTPRMMVQQVNGMGTAQQGMSHIQQSPRAPPTAQSQQHQQQQAATPHMMPTGVTINGAGPGPSTMGHAAAAATTAAAAASQGMVHSHSSQGGDDPWAGDNM